MKDDIICIPIPLQKKYYDGAQVLGIITDMIEDYDTVMKILQRFADEQTAQPEITVEQAICKLHAVGWMQSHDKILTESAQPERKVGEWIGTEFDGYADGSPVYYEWKCSACGCIVEDEEPTWNYCPSCGAYMRGEQDE